MTNPFGPQMLAVLVKLLHVPPPSRGRNRCEFRCPQKTPWSQQAAVLKMEERHEPCILHDGHRGAHVGPGGVKW